MKTVSQLKKDLEFNKGLFSLIDVLKNLAVAQYKILEQKMKSYKQIFLAIRSFFELIDTEKINHPFLKSSDAPIIIALTSDVGLLGGINMQIINVAISKLESKDASLIVIGERGKMYAQDRGVSFVSFSGIIDEERYAQAMQLRNYLFEKMHKESLRGIKVVYSHPVSFTVQRVSVITLLPFPFVQKKEISYVVKDVIFESDIEDVVEYLAYLWVEQQLYEIFGLNRLAEFAARYVHLEESLQKLKEMDNKLRLQYFKARHEFIDKNMRELFSARLLYADNY